MPTKTDAQKQAMRVWREKNKERLTAERQTPEHKLHQHEWYLKNRVKIIKKATTRQKKDPEKHRESDRKYNSKPEVRERHRIQSKLRWARIRKTVIEHYGGKCVCCGESRLEFLALDHINGGGSKHRREFGSGHLYHWVLKQNFPEGFQVLCHNCNLSLGHYGYCPHGTITREVLQHGRIKNTDATKELINGSSQEV